MPDIVLRISCIVNYQLVCFYKAMAPHALKCLTSKLHDPMLSRVLRKIITSSGDTPLDCGAGAFDHCQRRYAQSATRIAR